MASANPSIAFTAALGQRYEIAHLLSGRVKPRGIELEYPPVPRNPKTGAPMPLYSPLAREHPWDIGEQAFSTYLMARDAGKSQIALPIFTSRFFPHTGMWVNRLAAITRVDQLVGRRVACGSFATNYAVWCRGALTHQYDVPIQRITWIESSEEHLPEFRPPKRFTVERLPGQAEAVAVLADGKAEAASLPGPAGRADPERIKPLFDDPYPEMHDYVAAFGFIPINTVITVRREAIERNPDLARLVFEAFVEARAAYASDVSEGKEDVHMGLSLRRMREVTGLELPPHGFEANRVAIRTMIAYCYEQGVISKLVEPEELFALTDS